MNRAFLFLLTLAASAPAEKIVNWNLPSRGRTYTITSRQQGTFINTGRKWTYSPAPILPSAETNNQFVLLYVTCVNPGSNCQVTTQGLYAIFGTVSTSNPDQINFGSPQLLLNNPPGVSDFIAPRAIYHAGMWNVYVQGVATGSGTNSIFLARGGALTSLQWITEGGVAKKIVQINLENDKPLGAGIGEDHQWFNTAPYGGDPGGGYGLFGVYNDWNYPCVDSNPPTRNPPCSTLPGNGGAMFTNIGVTSDNPFYWYGPITDQAYTESAGSKYPDVMLTGTLDETAQGDLSFTLGDSCYAGLSSWRPLNMLAAYNHPYLYKSGTYYGLPGGETYNGNPGFSDSVIETSAVSGNNSGFRPRFARNAYGFITPVSESPRKWKTWVFYNPQQINTSNSLDCSSNVFSVDGFRNFDQGWGYSVVEITEQ